MPAVGGSGSGLAGIAEPTFSVGEVYDRLSGAIRGAFPSECWVTGEIRQHTTSRAGHHYIDLVDASSGSGDRAPTLSVVAYANQWPAVTRPLREAGYELVAGMVVRVRGRLGVYAPSGKISLTLAAIDLESLLGRLALERQRLIDSLKREGLYDRNRGVPLPSVPLRIGLVASPDTEGCRDFLGQLHGSGYGFRVTLVPSTVQGDGAPRELASAVGRLDTGMGPAEIDVIVLVRGGGSRGDLGAFDSEVLARAIAMASHPVWVGVGHTSDRSVADEIASRSFITPTACGQELVAIVDAFWTSVSVRASYLAERGMELVSQRDRMLHRTVERIGDLAVPRIMRAEHEVGVLRGRAVRALDHRLSLPVAHLEQSAGRLGTFSVRCNAVAIERILRSVGQLGHRAGAVLDRAQERSSNWERLLAAYDYHRQLERGYAIVRDEGGQVLRGIAAFKEGARTVTELSDGHVASVVEGISPALLVGVQVH